MRSGNGPGPTSEWCNQFTQGQVSALDKGGLNLAGEAECEGAFAPLLTRATTNAGIQVFELAADLDFVEHAEEQARIDVPGGRTLAGCRITPKAEVTGKRREVMPQSV